VPAGLEREHQVDERRQPPELVLELEIAGDAGAVVDQEHVPERVRPGPGGLVELVERVRAEQRLDEDASEPERRLGELLGEWDERGRPYARGLRVEATPLAAEPEPAGDGYVVERRWQRFVFVPL